MRTLRADVACATAALLLVTAFHAAITPGRAVQDRMADSLGTFTQRKTLFPAGATRSPGQDLGTLIVKFTPSVKGAYAWSTRTGHLDCDRILDATGVSEARQIMPPQGVPKRLQSLAARLGLSDYAAIRVPDGVDPALLKTQLLQMPDVSSVEYGGFAELFGAQITPNDPYFPIYQYALRNTGTQPPADPGTAGADAEMVAAWNFTTGDTSTVLAIIDTGLDILHPDFQGRLWTNPGEILDGADNDGNGLIDDIHGWNFGADNSQLTDNYGHGTHVSGIAAATGNDGIGIAGMDWKCRIMVCKIFGDDGSVEVDRVATAIEYAVNHGADVINLSFGYYTDFSVLRDAVAYATAAGAVVCAAIGNDNTSDPGYPASYDSVVTVGATDSNDRRVQPFCFSAPGSGSNFGPWIDVCAAGEYLWSDVPVALGSYTYMCGTSDASPHVAGLATLILALRPDYPADSVRRLICLGAEDQIGSPLEDTPGFDDYYGYGRINARITLQALALDFPPIIEVPGSQAILDGHSLQFGLTAADSNLLPPSLSILSPLPGMNLTDNGDGTAGFEWTPTPSQVGVHLVRFEASDGALADTGVVTIEVIPSCDCPCQCDFDCEGFLTATDLAVEIDVVFFGAIDPEDPSCPTSRADFNADLSPDAVDLANLIDHVFFGGAGPIDPCNP